MRVASTKDEGGIDEDLHPATEMNSTVREEERGVASTKICIPP
jgi:hypothetical protein